MRLSYRVESGLEYDQKYALGRLGERVAVPYFIDRKITDRELAARGLYAYKLWILFRGAEH